MFWNRIVFVALATTFLILTFPYLTSAKLLFEDDFEADSIGDPPAKWEPLGPPAGYDGGGLSVVEEDPLDANNKVFHLIPQAFDNNSHDIWAVHAGDESWVDYVFELDWLFPEDTYCPVTFRTMNVDDFCQISRRPGNVEFIIYAHNPAWGMVTKYSFPNDPLIWYRIRGSVKGNSFEFKIKERDDQTPFEEINSPEVFEEDDAVELFPHGGIGAQEGYTGIIDNVIVGETAADIMAVEPTDKAAICWGMLKSIYW